MYHTEEKNINPYSVVIEFRHQNLTSFDFRRQNRRQILTSKVDHLTEMDKKN